MFRRLAFLLVIITVLLFVSTVIAQDTTLQSSKNCHPSEIATDLQTQVAALDAAADDFLSQLQDIQALAGTGHLECSGMVLSGDKTSGKESVVLGPFDLAENTYRMVLTTDKYIYLTSDEVSGECRLISFLLDAGQASNGAEDVVKLRGDCRLVFTVKAEGAWTLVLEPLS